MQIWTEKYRPMAFKEIKGQEKIVPRIESFVKQKNLPHLLFAGPPGVGKTTTILATSIALYGESWRENILEMNASDERGIDIVRNQIKNFARTKSLGDVPFKLAILDEADALTKDAQHALRRTMEQYSNTCRFCLIANYSSKIIDPIQSRCAVFRFKPLEKDSIKEIIDKIEKEEKLKISDEAIEVLYEVSNGDVRKVENVLQSCAALSSEIDEKLIYEIVSAARPKEIKEILTLSISGKFVDARKQLLDVMLKQGLSGLDVVKQVQREIWDLDVDDEKKVKMVDKCGEIEFRMVEGSDEFIQLESLIASFYPDKNEN